MILNQLHYKKEHLLIWGGILSGIGIWLSSAIEGFLLIGSILTILCLNWIFFDQKIEGIIKYLKGSNDDFIVTSHISPDGDNIGSTLSMYYALNKLGKNVTSSFLSTKVLRNLLP